MSHERAQLHVFARPAATGPCPFGNPKPGPCPFGNPKVTASTAIQQKIGFPIPDVLGVLHAIRLPGEKAIFIDA